MTGIDFPSNPSTGQTYTFNSIVYTYTSQGVWQPGTVASQSVGPTGATGPAGTAANTGATGTSLRSIVLSIDGGGVAITTGVKSDLYCPYSCTITKMDLFADQSGSIVIDIWKDTTANYPPTVADTITASALPTLSSAIDTQDSTLTGWTKSITAGDTLRFNVNSCTTITRVCMVLEVSVP